MIKVLMCFASCCVLFPSCSAQDFNTDDFNRKVDGLLKGTVETMSVEALDSLMKNSRKDIQILDARKLEEYQTSRIPGAVWVSYKNDPLNKVNGLDKSKPTIVYCALGYRSEKVGEKLLNAGFADVRNLYGGVFDWHNKGYDLEHNDGSEPKKIHGYNAKWSRWINKADGVEVVW